MIIRFWMVVPSVLEYAMVSCVDLLSYMFASWYAMEGLMRVMKRAVGVIGCGTGGTGSVAASPVIGACDSWEA